MKLTGPEGVFELNILDYEYSDSPFFLDRNWLIVSLRTRHNGRECVRTAPLLSTWEIELLLKWMRSVASERELSPKLTFIEPGLGFNNVSRHNNQYTLRIKLSNEAQPNWHADNTPFWMPVTPDHDELEHAIGDLENQLRQFPVRN
ncbi:hypothetical protein DYU11_29715 [Fibrisoma montanum]|uniref:Uncharacterized protein n=1 Tax=Fibrisoma montanum TaxID=2305895 RepID=A0A418LY27_9BACT|nr:hypothetical protein [Fibrisoma montanum]RIV18135.1 hypothetical protein DYU11_29715 [Fibrisoma montanum]